jgi:hypothetical protein
VDPAARGAAAAILLQAAARRGPGDVPRPRPAQATRLPLRRHLLGARLHQDWPPRVF